MSWDLLIKLASLSRPILLGIVLATLALHFLRAFGIEPFISFDRGLYLTIVAAGFVCGCIALVDITPQIIRSIRGCASKCRTYLAKRKRALQAMERLTPEFEDVLWHLKRNNIRRFEVPGRPGAIYAMEQECLLDRYNPVYAREARTAYRVPRYVWRRIVVGQSNRSAPSYEIVRTGRERK